MFEFLLPSRSSLPVLLALLLSACSSTVPNRQDFKRYDKQYSMMIAKDIDKLQGKYAAGKITEAELEAQIASLEAERYARVNDLVHYSYLLKQNYTRSMGIPIGQAMGSRLPAYGARGGTPTASSYLNSPYPGGPVPGASYGSGAYPVRPFGNPSMGPSAQGSFRSSQRRTSSSYAR